MKRFKSILLICDEGSVDDAVMARTIGLAKANGARVTVVDVLDVAPGELTRLFSSLPGVRAHDAEYEVLQFYQSRLERVAARFEDESIEVSEAVLLGIPFMEIIRKVLRDGHDLVMKQAGGAREGRSMFFASTDLHLLRKCPCPVWIMKTSGRPHYASILAAVDPVPEDEQRSALATLTMDLATSLARMDDSELHIVNAWQLDEENTLRDSAFLKFPSDKVDALVEARRQENERNLEALLSDYPTDGLNAHSHLLKGEPRDVIPDFADQQRIELIVMGTVGRTGIRGLFIGNTAEAILSQVQCSVLAVKPPGFETPVHVDLEAGEATNNRARNTRRA
ncbi:MAG: universal stress protein [Hyphomicrobiales bacterium]|nr:universal stress protein [Hyphomicrobiales bacterium]